MKLPNVAGSDGGATPPAPEAQRGDWWTTTRTLMPRALSSATRALSWSTWCWTNAPGPGWRISHDVHKRTQSAPSRWAVGAVWTVWPSVSLTPVSAARAGAAAHAKAAATARPAMRRVKRIAGVYPIFSAGGAAR